MRERFRAYILPHASPSPRGSADFAQNNDARALVQRLVHTPKERICFRTSSVLSGEERHVVSTGASAFDVVPTTLNVNIEPAEANTSVAGGFRRSLTRGVHGSASVCVAVGGYNRSGWARRGVGRKQMATRAGRVQNARGYLLRSSAARTTLL